MKSIADEIFAKEHCVLCGKVILKAEFDHNKGICHPDRLDMEREG